MVTLLKPSDLTTRFAPTPSGFLHLGHGLSALLCNAIGQGFILRIEDIDTSRAKNHFVDALLEDLKWLECHIKKPIITQSNRTHLYQQHLNQLIQKKYVFPCFCSRKHVTQNLLKSTEKTPQNHLPFYPGTCRHLSHPSIQKKIAQNQPFSWRLDSRAFLSAHPQTVSFHDIIKGHPSIQIQKGNDIVIARQENQHTLQISYHLASVVDDAEQRIPLIVRGEDLLHSTYIHRILQILLNFQPPLYLHHGLIKNEKGRKLSKRNGDTALHEWRKKGKTKDDVLQAVYNLYKPCLDAFQNFTQLYNSSTHTITPQPTL
jgi:glutamyl-Q tRNA(Asp) synthetase